jgi:hypothetical protein
MPPGLELYFARLVPRSSYPVTSFSPQGVLQMEEFEEFEKWIQDAMYHMMMAKLNENAGIKHESGQTLFRVMRANEISFKGMHECGIESYDVSDEIRNPETIFITPR